MRITVYLATVLFLIAISSHFSIRGVRIGLIAVGGAVLLVSGDRPGQPAPAAGLSRSGRPD